MAVKILEDIANGFSNELVRESKTLVADLTDEIWQLLNQNIRKYFKDQIKLNRNVKNILYGSNPVDIHDFYFPVKIKPKITLEWQTDTSSVSNVFCRTNYLTIIGDAGCGKTTLSRFLLLDCLQSKSAIPVFIELRNLSNTNIGVLDYIKEKLLFFHVAENDNILTRMLQRGKFIFFIDGYDELPYSTRSEVTHDLLRFVQKNANNKFLITSRPYSSAESLPMFQNYYVKKLTEEEVDSFIKFQLKNEKVFCDKILDSVKEARLKNLDEFLSNPLLLSLYILTFQYNSDIPNRKHLFYRRVIQTLYSEHDSISKAGFIRQTKSNLSQEQLEELLKKFSFVSYFDNRFSFDLDYIHPIFKLIRDDSHLFSFSFNEVISDLKSLSLWVEDSGIYSFNHRSIQEYFAALCVKELDSAEKRSIYDQLTESVKNNTFTEIEHYLSLCEELDEIDYYRLFYIPITSSIISTIELQTDEKVLQKVLPYFCQRIHRKAPDQITVIHPLVKLPNIAGSSEYHAIVQILKRELNNIHSKGILRGYWAANSLTIHNEFQRNYSKSHIELSLEFPQVLLEYFLSNRRLILLLREFVKKLELSSVSLLNYIDYKRESNRNLLNMIKSSQARKNL